MTPHHIPHFYTSLSQSPLFSCWSTSPLDPSGRRRAHSQRLNRDGKEKHVWSHHHMLLLWCNESIFSNNDVGGGSNLTGCIVFLWTSTVKRCCLLIAFDLNLHCLNTNLSVMIELKSTARSHYLLLFLSLSLDFFLGNFLFFCWW